MAEDRLDKLLCGKAGVARNEARKLIKAGRVTVGGTVIKSPEQKIGPDAVLCLDGEPLGAGGFRYIMMNKPQGVVSATKDRDQRTVLDLLPENMPRRGLFPVGRLDKDVTGLLIITDDGDFGHQVTSPKRHIPKVYEVHTAGEMTVEDVTAFAGELTLRDGTRCLPARLTVDEKDLCHAFVEIFEGKYHQVKRMFASVGKPVLKLRRLSVGGLSLDGDLAEGCFREMTADEIKAVFLE